MENKRETHQERQAKSLFTVRFFVKTVSWPWGSTESSFSLGLLWSEADWAHWLLKPRALPTAWLPCGYIRGQKGSVGSQFQLSVTAPFPRLRLSVLALKAGIEWGNIFPPPAPPVTRFNFSRTHRAFIPWASLPHSFQSFQTTADQKTLQ